MAIGVIFGGIFLYLYAQQTLPAIIAFPIFIVSSGLGLFFGLVPINDQKADVYVKNYITAITSPTQRVWKSKELDKKLSKEELDVTRGNMNRNPDGKEKPKIIGGGFESQLTEQQQSAADVMDIDEQKRLEGIEKVAQTAGLGSTQSTPVQPQNIPTQQTTPTFIQPASTPQPVQNTQQSNKVLIAKNNLGQYHATQLDPLNTNGTVNLLLSDNQGASVPAAIVTVKDMTGRVIGAYRSNEQGVILTDKKLNPGTYYVNIRADKHSFSPFEVLVEGDEVMKIKITAQ